METKKNKTEIIRLEFEAEILPQIKIFNDKVSETDKKVRAIRKNKGDYQATLDDRNKKIESLKKQIAEAVIDGEDEAVVKDLEEVLHQLQSDVAASVEVVQKINAKLTKVEEQHRAARIALAAEAGKIRLRLCKTAVKYKAQIGRMFGRLLVLAADYEKGLKGFADHQEYVNADFNTRTFLIDALHSVDRKLLYNSKRLTDNLAGACMIAEKKLRAKQIAHPPTKTPQAEEEADARVQVLKELRTQYRYISKRKVLIRSRQEAKNYIASTLGDDWKNTCPEAIKIIAGPWPDDIPDNMDVKKLPLPSLKEYAQKLDIKIHGMSREQIEGEVEAVRAANKKAAKSKTESGPGPDFDWDIDHTVLPPSFLITYTENVIKYAKLIGVNPQGLNLKEIKDRIREFKAGPKAYPATLLKDVAVEMYPDDKDRPIVMLTPQPRKKR